MTRQGGYEDVIIIAEGNEIDLPKLQPQTNVFKKICIATVYLIKICYWIQWGCKFTEMLLWGLDLMSLHIIKWKYMVKRPKEGMDYMGGEVKKGWVSSVHSLSEANNNCKCR